MDNVIKAEEKFTGKEKSDQQEEMDDRYTALQMNEGRTWFSSAGAGLAIQPELATRIAESVGEELKRDYMLACVLAFATGFFGDSPDYCDVIRLNNMVNKRAVQGRYPINPDISIDAENNEFWIVVNDGHREMFAFIPDESGADAVRSFYNEYAV